MYAQTRPFDKATVFFAQQVPRGRPDKLDGENQQLKKEMGIEHQDRAGDIRSLLGQQANTPRPKSRLSVKLKRRRNVKKGLRCWPSCTTEDSLEREREISTGSWWRRNFSDASSVGEPRSSTKPRSCSTSVA